MDARQHKTCIRFAFALFLGVGSGLHGRLQAQEPGPPSRLIKILEKETSRKSEENVLKQPEVVMVVIPFQLFTPPSAAFFPCPGISDPGMDTLQARKQAIERAWMLRGMLSDATLRHISDHFVVSRPGSANSGTRFEEYYEIRANYPRELLYADSSVHLSKLSSGEYIAWIPARDHNSPQAADSSGITEGLLKATLYLNDKLVFRPRLAFRAIYQAGFPAGNAYRATDGMEFTWYPGGKCLYLTPADTLEPQTDRKLYYYMTGENNAGENSPGGIPVLEGLWPALMSCLMIQLTELPDTGNAKLKSLNETYRDEASNLQRTIRTANVSFVPGCISIRHQKLYCAAYDVSKPQESKEP